MCGITGVMHRHGSGKKIDPVILERMTDQIVHRGPDDSGHYVSEHGTVGLGFRRLSIVDLSLAGHQPMSTEDGKITLIFNGEIYNHREIRAELEKRGYRYRSQTDTETILYAYREYGLDFITKLYGMFAIAIWDETEGVLTLIRDRIGIKPVYYSWDGDTLLFGSEIKSLLEHPSVQRKLNPQGLYDYLTMMMTPPNETMFAGIYKLEAGHVMQITRNGQITTRRYWNLDHQTTEYSPKDLKSEEFCIEEIRRLLRDSVRLRMMSDVPFGVLLSGGIDSSLNVALMAELMSRPVETFSVGYRDLQKYNELGYAQQIAQQFKTNHHEIFIEERDLIDFLPQMVWHLDEPNGDPVCVPMYYVSKLARDSGTVVVQVGEGSDEQFSGYKHYLREIRFHRYYHRLLPRFARKVAHAVLHRREADSTLTEYARRSVQDDVVFYGGMAPGFGEVAKSRLLSASLLTSTETTGRIPSHYFSEAPTASNGSHNGDYLRRMIYYEFKNRLAELLLMRVDKMSMAVSVEARVPFLDHRLVEFSYRIPMPLKLKKGEPKYILKKASEGIIPDNIIYRKKQGFAAPVHEWLQRGKLAEYANDIIFESPLLKEGILDKSYTAALFKRHQNNEGNYSPKLWNLLILALWHRRFFEAH